MNGEDGFDLTGSGAEPLHEDDPRRIGPFPLVGRLGAGGMGRVYLGVHEDGYAAVKQVLPSVAGEDKDFLRRFGHELDNLARLPEHATARLIASDREANPPWFATAYVPGLTLREAVDLHGGAPDGGEPDGGALPADALWLLLREAAKGLAAVHELGMVHRDVKPSNVMLTVDGLTLIDFGVARAAEQSRLTRTGMVVGTPAYMSPEQASGARRLTGAVDVFALGSVVAYAGCGRPPFGDESGHAVLYRIVHEEPDLAPLRALDAELASVVASCLDKDPEGRPMAAELLDLAAAHAPQAPAWPAAVAERLAERAAFATTTPPAPDPAATIPAPAPAPSATPDPAGPGTPGPGTPGPGTPGPGTPGPGTPGTPVVTTRPAPDEKRRRTRVLLAVVPVVVVATATTVALQLLPYSSSPSHDGAGPSASAPVASSPGPTAPARATPSSSASAGRDGTRPSASPGTTLPAGGGAVAAGGAQADPGGGTGSGGTTTSGSTGGSGSGSGSGSASGGTGASGSGTTSAGTGTGTGSGSGTGTGTGTGTASQAPSSGYVHLRNAENGKCVTQVYGSTSLGACSGSAAAWSFRSAGNGTVKVINQSSGSCLSANFQGQSVVVGDCSQGSSALLWRTGSGSTLISAFNSGCLDLAFGGGVTTQTCGSGTASQQWARS